MELVLERADPLTMMNEPNVSFELMLTSPLYEFGAGKAGKRVSERRQYALFDSEQYITKQYNEAFDVANEFSLKSFQIYYPDFRAFEKSSLSNDLHHLSIISEVDDKQLWVNAFPKVHHAHAEFWSHNAVSEVIETDDCESKLIVCCDVLPYVKDPRVILRAIRSLLLKNEKNICFLSIDSKNRCGSPNRKWSFLELQRVLLSSGFLIESSREGEIISFVLRCSADTYQRFLSNAGFETQNFSLTKRLLLTTEHPRAGKSGGIGSYYQEIQTLVGSNIAEICFVSQHLTPTPFALSNEKVLGFVINDDSYDELNDSDIALLLVEQALFYLPNIEVIEYQDYQGIGGRIVQARNAGLFPAGISLEVGCHGSILYVEAANQKWCGHEHNELITLEKIAIEGADRVRFPTKFLQRFYEERGYLIDVDKIIFERYPFTVSPRVPVEFTDVERIVFVGKQSPMKGFPEFLEVIYELVSNNKLTGLQEIVCFGPVVDISLLDNHRKEFLKTKLRWREEFLERDIVQSELKTLSSNSVAFIPYRGDNHPNVILEILNSGMPLLAFSTGGIPELIPESSHGFSLCKPTIHDAKNALINLWFLSTEKRKDLANNSYELFKTNQDEINKAITKRYSDCSPKVKRETSSYRGSDFTFIIPIYNTKISYILELIESINIQSQMPKEVIWIDDASDESYANDLEAIIKQNLKLPYRIIRHAHNLGLSGARNTALSSCTSEFLINIDSDDIITPDFLSIISKTCNLNPKSSVIVPYLEAFDDGDHWQSYDSTRYIYRPLGQGIIFGQLENRFGHANSAYRVSDIKSVGGWNQDSRAMWEDWELFGKLACTGRTITIIPAIAVLYRVQSKSMARTYARFPAMERIVNGQNLLPRFESFRLQAMMRDFLELSEYQERYEELKSEYDEMSKQYNRIAHRFIRIIIALIEKLNLDFLYKQIKNSLKKSSSSK